MHAHELQTPTCKPPPSPSISPQKLTTIQIHSKLTWVCHLFATYTTTLSRQLFSASQSLAGTPAATTYLTAQFATRHRPVPEDLLKFDPDRLGKLDDMMDKYEYNFNHHLRLLLDALDYYAATETVALGRLCAQLAAAGERGGEEGGRGGFG